MSDEFNAAALLKLGKDKLAVAIAPLTKAQLQELLAAEQANGATARVGVVRLLQGEIDAKAAQLSEESIEQLAIVAGVLADKQPAWNRLPDAVREEATTKVLVVLTDPNPDCEDLFVLTVVTLAPLFNQIEALAAQVDFLSGVRERETVGPGALAETVGPIDGKVQGKLLDKVAALAFCEGDVIRFKLDASREDFVAVEGLATRYDKPVVLQHDKPRVRIDAVVALTAEGIPIARVSWPRPLEGGGGREGKFPRGHIAFAL